MHAPGLTKLSPGQANAEIRDSKAIVEDALGVSIDSFAYPYGRYDCQSRAIVRECFACACSDRLDLAGRDSDLYALKRVDAYYFRTGVLFNIMLGPFFRSYLVARSIPRRLRRAVPLSCK